MLTLDPLIDRRLCRVFVIQTFTRWFGGVAREDYADAWLAATGALTPEESHAIEVLRAAMPRDRGCTVIRALALDDPTLAPALRAASDALAARAARIVEEAEPALRYWQRQLQGPFPAWYECMRETLDRFFGTSGMHPFRVYLLPSGKGSVSGNGDMFVENGATNLDCSGLDAGGLVAALTTVLHEGVHSIYQRLILTPLVDAAVDTPEGERMEALRRESPVPFGLDSYVGELVAGALEGGILREHCGLGSQPAHWQGVVERAYSILDDASFDGWDYDAWVGLGVESMIPVAAGYLSAGRAADAGLVREALTIFESTYRRWENAHGGQRPVSPRAR